MLMFPRQNSAIQVASRSPTARDATPLSEANTQLPVTIDFGDVQLESEYLLGQLKNDMRDDWFPDPLGYSDMFDGHIVAERIAQNIAEHHGRYIPGNRDLFNVPKSNFTLRCALETSLCDRALYHGLTSYLMPFYDRLFYWGVFSHRYDYNRAGRKSLFKRAVPAWKDSVGSVRSALGPNDYLLSTDLTNFYEHINLDTLHQTAVLLLPKIETTATEKGKIRSRIELLFDCLGPWSYQKTHGLPQNRDASSFLANLYLFPVDEQMRAKGYDNIYFRYMDDMKVVCRDHFHARRALKDLSLALRDVGLSVNPKKTQICEGSSTKEINEHLDDGFAELQYLDLLWNTKSREAILRCIPRLKDLTLRLIEGQRTQGREFRFCINRLEKLALCDDLYVPEEFFRDITSFMVDGLIDNPSSTDQFVGYLAAVTTSGSDLSRIAEHLRNADRALYSWQNYQLWSLLARKGYTDSKTLDYAAQLIAGSGDTATRAGATLYVGVKGDAGKKAVIASRFSR